MKFRFLHLITLILFLLTIAVNAENIKREDGKEFQPSKVETYIIVLKDSLSQEAFNTKINTLTTLIGEENITQVYRMPGFRGLAAKIPNSLLEKIKADEAVDYIEKDSTVSIN